MKKRYIVYIEIPYDHAYFEFERTRFYITAWLMAKKD